MSYGQINLLDEIIVDSFAGGGGASTGIELAAGRVVDIAINHDPDAILMHRTNHPHTQHFQASVWDVDPEEVCRGRSVGLLWASPDCKHFLRHQGGSQGQVWPERPAPPPAQHHAEGGPWSGQVCNQNGLPIHRDSKPRRRIPGTGC